MAEGEQHDEGKDHRGKPVLAPGIRTRHRFAQSVEHPSHLIPHHASTTHAARTDVAASR
jgi:hypothetical protein